LSPDLLSVDGITTIDVAFVQRILGIALAAGAIYFALNIFHNLTKGIEKSEEITKGSVAVALGMAGIIIAVIIQSGVIGITASLVKYFFRNFLSPVPVDGLDQLRKTIHFHHKYLVPGHTHAGFRICSQHIRTPDHLAIDPIA